MSIARSNSVLRQLLEYLMAQMGRSQSCVRFEDTGIPQEDEPYFDGMVRWAQREGLISLQGSENLNNSHTELSYAKLLAPEITSFGIAVYGFAVARMSGNIVQATAFMKNAEHLNRRGETAGEAEDEGGFAGERLPAPPPRGALGLESQGTTRVRIAGQAYGLAALVHSGPRGPRPRRG